MSYIIEDAKSASHVRGSPQKYSSIATPAFLLQSPLINQHLSQRLTTLFFVERSASLHTLHTHPSWLPRNAYSPPPLNCDASPISEQN